MSYINDLAAELSNRDFPTSRVYSIRLQPTGHFIHEKDTCGRCKCVFVAEVGSLGRALSHLILPAAVSCSEEVSKTDSQA